MSSAMWDVLSSWFTPTTLFLFLNFTIATIYVTSVSSSSQKPPSSPTHQKPDSQDDLHRTTSVLQRLKSVNFYHYANYYIFHESPAQTLIPEPEEKAEIEPVVHQSSESENRFDEEKEAEGGVEIGVGGERSLDEVYSQLQRGSHNRSKSDMEPAVKLVKRMKKSASSKSAFKHFKEAEILEARRPATVKEAKTPAEDEEVDSKADDFINKFKRQLHLQRLDSILRYKEMLGRGVQK